MSERTSRWVGHQGGCLCGAIRYELTGEPMALVACHCTDCQRRGGGPLSLSMPMAEKDVRLLQGTPLKREERVGDRVKTNDFCGECHTRLLVRNTAAPEVVIVKATTLDDCSDLRPVAHMWVRSRQPWFALEPGVLTFETQPPFDEFPKVIKAWAAQEREQDGA